MSSGGAWLVMQMLRQRNDRWWSDHMLNAKPAIPAPQPLVEDVHKRSLFSGVVGAKSRDYVARQELCNELEQAAIDCDLSAEGDADPAVKETA